MTPLTSSRLRPSGSAATLAPAISSWIAASAVRHYFTLIVSALFLALAHVFGARLDWRAYAVMGAWVVAHAVMTRWAARPASYDNRRRRYAWTIVIDVLFLGVTYLLLGAAQYLGIAFFAHMALIATATLPRRWALGVAVLIVVVYATVVTLAVTGIVSVASPIGLPPVTGNRLFIVAGIVGALWTVALLMHLQTRFVTSMRDAERKYVTLVESASDMVMTFDHQGHFAEVNPATLEQSGYTWEELRRLPNTGFFPQADWPAVMGAFARTKVGESVHLEVRYVRKDGAERWVHTSAFPLTVDGGEATVVIARDVTDAHRRHDELREKDLRLNIVLGALKAGFITFDREVRVTSVFGDWAREQETKGVQLIGTDMHGLFGDDAAGSIVEQHQQACEGALSGEERSVSWTYPTQAGERSFRSHLVPLRDAEGAIIGGVALWVDETALAVAERERVQLRERVADAERIESLGKLVSGVAHELNNPLAAILNFTEDLLADIRTPEERLALEVIQAQALRSRTIVRDLLTYARRDVARTLTPVAPGPILHSLARAMQRGFATQGVNFTVELRDAEQPLPLDRTGFEQVVTNLLTNAGQAAGAGGSVRLSSRVKEGRFEVIVEDNGAGIAAEVAERIFEPFFTTKPTGHGVGLGLSVSAGIVQAHGGTLVAQNRPAAAGGGARFVLRLPAAFGVVGDDTARPTALPGEDPVMLPRVHDTAARVAPIAEAVSQPRAMPERKPTILIIDDERAIRQGLRRYLTRRGWAVEESADGADALAKLLRPDAMRIYDVVLCDLKMAGVSGMDVYERVLTTVPAIAQRFILSTGDTSAPDVAGFLAQVTVPILEKPFELTALESLAAQVRAGGGAGAGSGGRGPA